MLMHFLTAVLTVVIPEINAQEDNEPLIFRIPDGTKENSYIGNLPQNANLDSPSNAYLRKFVIVAGDNLIKIDENTGDIRTSVDIDRETLCNRLKPCSYDAEIITTPQDFFKLFKVEIWIDDLNDNSPIFPNPTINLNLAENAKIGTFLRLDSATDADTPEFGIVRYELENGGEYFDLVQEDIDGSLIPQLKLTKLLDFEKRPEHQMTLSAIDGGVPARIGTANVIVKVVDVNDHSPVFPSDRIECNIAENLEVGDVVTMLNATDADFGENSRITYSYQKTLVTPELAAMFVLDGNTGIISVGRPLDFESVQQHILYIKAEDNGPNSVPTYATVVINILDVNDNKPEIKVNFIGDSSEDDIHYISEDIAVGEFLAFVSVTDKDAIEKGRNLKTELEPTEDFELVTVDEKNNRYILKTKKLLDRERIETYQLTIKSVDNGSRKRLKSVKNISIILTDVNDNAPYFAHGQYHVSVVENNQIGEVITQLVARDMDAGDNSVLTYSLASPSENFEIKAETGEVVALTQLDAEKLLEPEILEIVARDNGNPSLVGTTTLRISIKDFNDNAPMFIKKDYEFNIIENLPLSFIIGQVEAIDGDINTDLKYQIVQTYSFFPFDIDSETGKIFVNSKLDYEAEYQDYIFQVQAIDSDGFNDLANVTIHILDENDNAPKVKYPHPAKDIVWLNPSSSVIGQLVCQVVTLDPDSGANGIVNYEIEGGSGAELVNVNQKGELILQKELTENDQGKFSVFLRITDQGEVQKFTTTRINLYIAMEKYSEEELPSLLRQYREELALPSVAGVSQLALLLVAAFSALVFILLLFTVCLYCRFSKKRDKDDHHDIYQEQITTVNQMGTPHNRQETDLKMAQWSELKQQHMMASHQNQSERSFNSGQSASGSCTRDSGAGDSVESEYDTLDGPINDHNQPLIYHVTKFSPTPEYSPTLTYSQRNSAHLIPRKPTFTTFMGDSDTDSVQIVDYTKVNV